MTDILYNTIQARTAELTALRREFHQIPETAWQEVRTTANIRSYLEKLPLTLSPLPIPGHDTGVLAVLSCGDGPVVTLRFDIDALPMQETSAPSHLAVQEHFQSRYPGRMHACGHDGHIAIGLLTAAILCEHKESLHGTVQFLFQPAEEGCRGAKPIAESHLLDSTDYFLAGHIVPAAQYPDTDGDFIMVDGSFATTKLDISLFGKAAHAAHPKEGQSVMPALGRLLTAMYDLIPLDREDIILNVGKLQAGTARNILAARAALEVEMRGMTTEKNNLLTENVFSIIQSIAKQHKVTIETEITGSAPSLESSAALADRLYAYFQKKPSSLHVSSHKTTRFLASEDASHLMECVKSHGGQAAYMLFPAKTTAVLHQSNYSFDENVLLRATIFYIQATLCLLH